MLKSNKGTFEVQMLSAHDLAEVQVIMRNHVPNERCKAIRRKMASDFLGCSLESYIPGFDL